MLSDEEEQHFIDAVTRYKKMRARFVQRQELKGEFELLIKFDDATYPLFGLYQQAVVGDINVPKLDYTDPEELSYMWAWIKGNRKWHAWNKCKGLSKNEAKELYISEVDKLESELPFMIEDWKDEQDPRIPDQTASVPEEEQEQRRIITAKAKAARRSD
uniref:ACB domain-containing protein n=1 Tax=Syphacia muris TaxID=451379 RepID=A0A0N5AQC9_9BILA